LEARRAHFRSLGDLIDTAKPPGRLSLQMMGAVAEPERARADQGGAALG
jgi:hypothetical protein